MLAAGDCKDCGKYRKGGYLVKAKGFVCHNCWDEGDKEA